VVINNPMRRAFVGVWAEVAIGDGTVALANPQMNARLVITE
jgi:hypothetical protein